ncbi:MAG: hypothetical protein Q9N32_07235 [Gammaproteobacteria bacterium]|nr:hypothetical protein [Gammaproteobacteria bacterium]
MKNLVLIASLLISSNMAYADGKSHDHDMKKMEHSHTDMSEHHEGKAIEHKHKGKSSPIAPKKDHKMESMRDEKKCIIIRK